VIKVVDSTVTIDRGFEGGKIMGTEWKIGPRGTHSGLTIDKLILSLVTRMTIAAETKETLVKPKMLLKANEWRKISGETSCPRKRWRNTELVTGVLNVEKLDIWSANAPSGTQWLLLLEDDIPLGGFRAIVLSSRLSNVLMS